MPRVLGGFFGVVGKLEWIFVRKFNKFSIITRLLATFLATQNYLKYFESQNLIKNSLS